MKTCIGSIGVGIDIEDIGRFSRLRAGKNKAFLDRVYTAKEIKYCLSKESPSRHLAARFAGKEAVIKAVSGLGGRIGFDQIEILNGPKGNPMVTLKNRRFKNIAVTVSLSHCKDKAVAVAWGIRDGRC